MGVANTKAAFYLENGHLFLGRSFGSRLIDGGEAVFNTGMSGYQEIITDPSYCKQIIVMTSVHMGNTGVNSVDTESLGLRLKGFVVREFCDVPSNWRSELSLSSYLEKAGVAGISEVDTREITQLLRDEGAQRGVIFPVQQESINELKTLGRKHIERVAPMEGLELVSEVSTEKRYEFTTGKKELPKIVVYDYGVKHNILRNFEKRGFQVVVVPYQYPYQEVMKEKPKAVVLSNGPGDPATVTGAVEQIQKLIGQVPILGICMGHQLLARSFGAKTFKLKFGHHGINHPVKDLVTGKIVITSQNHGFAVRNEDVSQGDLKLTHVSLNDDTCEGFASQKLKLMSVQFHPEAAPGPQDADLLFEQFVRGVL